MAGPGAPPVGVASGFDPVFGSQATFRAVLDAMARPGTLHHLPVADPACPLVAARPLTAILQTLLDHEVGFGVVGAPEDTDRLSAYLVETTASRSVPLEEADYVVALGPLRPGLPLRLKRGEPAYPDRGATLICLVPPLTGDRDEQIAVSLAGPGIPPDADTTVRLSGPSLAVLTALAAANAEPPCGIDLILVDPAGRIVCLPRSTRITMRR
jgi:alpha-D-ribose 1-methylphosphonate 5-triphosphate synthase subunit PhnH